MGSSPLSVCSLRPYPCKRFVPFGIQAYRCTPPMHTCILSHFHNHNQHYTCLKYKIIKYICHINNINTNNWFVVVTKCPYFTICNTNNNSLFYTILKIYCITHFPMNYYIQPILHKAVPDQYSGTPVMWQLFESLHIAWGLLFVEEHLP